MGHALTMTLQDTLIRWRRMQGRDALWQPGTDHAGIATQMVVERLLPQEGNRPASRWAATPSSSASGSGRRSPAAPSPASCAASAPRSTGRASASPWTRACPSAVREVFVTLYREGLIYRDRRLVNWDPKFQSAISDLEVESREVRGSLWHIRYPIEGEDRTASSSSRRRGRRRCWATPRSRCIPTMRATATWSAGT